MPGLSGNESAINGFLQERWSPYAQEIKLNPVGNLLAHIGGDGPNLLILAHADEHGFLVKSISEDGFLFLNSTRLGLRPPSGLYVIGQPALIQGRQGPIEGIFAAVSGHVMTASQAEKHKLDWNDIFVDIGCQSREEVLAQGIQVGCPIVPNPPTRRFGNFFCGKAMDDRALLAVMDELLRHLEMDKVNYNLYFASTVQEEMGMVGAHSLFRALDVEQAICLDIGLAGDVPGVDEQDIPVKLGAGPVLVHKDNYIHYSPRLTAALTDAAEKADIPIQHAVFPSYASDGAELIRHGIETALVAPPVRYTHSPFEMAHEDDLLLTVQLLKAFLEKEL